MARTTATEGQLGALHAKIAAVMTKVLTSYEKAQDAFEQLIEAGADPEQLLEFPDISPAMLGAITKFLADNKITAAPEEGEGTSKLQDALEERRAKRSQRRVGNVTFLEAEQK